MKHKFKLPKDFTPTLEIKNGFATINIPETKMPLFYEDDIIVFYKEEHAYISVFKYFVSDESFKSKACVDFPSGKTRIKEEILTFDSIRKALSGEKTFFNDSLAEICLEFIDGSFDMWKATYQRRYYRIGPNLEVSKQYIPYGELSKLKDGNCFPNREMANKVRDRFVEVIKEYHKKLQDDTRSEDSNWM